MWSAAGLDLSFINVTMPSLVHDEAVQSMTKPRRRTARKPGRPAVLLDRDGVLNVDHGYVADPERLEWIPGAKRAVRRLNEAGVLAIVCTNQSGVARGMFDLAAVERLHGVMQADLAVEGARIDAFYVCPFHADAADPAYAHPDHPDRKPNPGMLLRAIEEWSIDPDAVPDGRRQALRRRGRPAGGHSGAPVSPAADLDAFLAPLIPGETKGYADCLARDGRRSLEGARMLPFIDLAAQQARIKPADRRGHRPGARPRRLRHGPGGRARSRAELAALRPGASSRSPAPTAPTPWPCR